MHTIVVGICINLFEVGANIGPILTSFPHFKHAHKNGIFHDQSTIVSPSGAPCGKMGHFCHLFGFYPSKNVIFQCEYDCLCRAPGIDSNRWPSCDLLQPVTSCGLCVCTPYSFLNPLPVCLNCGSMMI